MIHTCANLSNLSNLLHFLPVILPILRSRTKYYHLYLYELLKKVFVLFSILCRDDRRDHPRYPLAITHFHYCFHFASLYHIGHLLVPFIFTFSCLLLDLTIFMFIPMLTIHLHALTISFSLQNLLISYCKSISPIEILLMLGKKARKGPRNV